MTQYQKSQRNVPTVDSSILPAVEAGELHGIVGGKSRMSKIKGALKWVRRHFDFSGTDMGGNSAVVFSIKGGWHGNP